MPFQGQNVTVTPTPAGQPAGSGLSVDGSIPQITANDGTYARAAMGNLPNYTGPDGTNSPAQWGFRGLDPNGNAIFDSMGLIATMQQLGNSSHSTSDSVSTANTSTYALFGADTQFTINVTKRPVRILYMIFVAAKTTGAGGQVAYVRGNIVGANTTAGIIFDKNNTGWTNGSMWYFTGPGGNMPNGLPIGSYTVQLEGSTDNGQTIQLTQFTHVVWQLGA